MRDLDWLNADGYVFIIKNFENFMENDISKKEKIMYYFEDEILPWWEEEVERCVLGGKAKPFNLYLVD